MNHKLSHLIDLIDRLPPEQAQHLLSQLIKEQPLVGFKILTRQFSFDDLARANDAGIAELCKIVPMATLAVALNGSSERLIKVFLQGFSQIDAQNLVEQLYSARVTDTAVQNARQKVLIKAFLLKQKGRLSLD